jgi:hypothetical protein
MNGSSAHHEEAEPSSSERGHSLSASDSDDLGDGFFTPSGRDPGDVPRSSFDDDAHLSDDYGDADLPKRRRPLTPEQELRRARFVRLVAGIIGFGVAVFLVALIVSRITGPSEPEVASTAPATEAEPTVTEPAAVAPIPEPPAPEPAPQAPPEPAPKATLEPAATPGAKQPPGGAARSPSAPAAARPPAAPRVPAVPRAPAAPRPAAAPKEPATAPPPAGVRPPTASFPTD